MTSSKVIVNPKLFVTCRLCLDDQGIYQIVPEIKDQIQFCFDIKVEQFDGLPQLICAKCENLLNTYYETKKKFIAKQLELRSRKILPGSNAVSQTPRVVVKPVDNKIHSVVSSSVDPPSWSKEYRKRFHCKYCNRNYSAKKYLLVHLSKHKRVKEKFSYIFKKHCQVKLEKLDGKVNFTGSNDKVVYDKNKIIETRNGDHYIIYSNNNDYASSACKVYNYMDIQYDSTDSHSEEDILKRKSAKRRRIYSTSSTDTVVLDEESNGIAKPQQVTDVDNIDEDSRSSQNTNNKKNDADKIQNDGAIQKIIHLCSSKFNSSETGELSTKPKPATPLQLKRKILSIGRKIINTKDFNATAFLRFLQSNNLNINWNNMNLNLVKIMTKAQNDMKDSESKNDPGWDVHDATQKYSFPYEQYCNACADDDQPVNAGSIIENNIHFLPNNEYNVTNTFDSAVLCSLTTNDTMKLLNANPVANPKQLPKKSPNNDKIITKVPSVPESEICMPIITSTTSLVETEAVPEPPRIKVKPFSELLSKESMNRLIDASKSVPTLIQNDKVITEVQNIYLVPQIQATHLNIPGVNVNISSVSNNAIISANNSTKTSGKPIEYLNMDTAEMPNTRTDSPFNYLKNLLLMHNIFLLKSDVILTEDFHCLIKFKVEYKQEIKEGRPVTLGLSLYNHKNVFCLKVKDHNDECMDLMNLSANWQWEILKVYKGEVGSKLLNNAMKVSQETFEYTKNFLCLLKSIKCTP